MRDFITLPPTLICIFSVALLASGCNKDKPGSTPADSTVHPTKFFEVDADRTLTRPEGYREWVFVGTPVTPNQLNLGKAPFPEMHNVYIDPKSYAAYASTGKFPDGTILIKELTDIGATHASSGNGFFEGNFIGLEATIKSAEHNPDEPGNWAYYSFSNAAGGPLSRTAKPFPASACNSCHENEADDDFVFTQYYPVLRDTKNDKPSNADWFTISDGVLQQPVGYRRWVFVGTPVTPNDLNDGKAAFPEAHNVYLDPESYAHLKKTGKFRDGAIMIKELAAIGAKKASSGNGYFMGDFIGLEATIKSTKHFPDEPGNWAYFSFTDKGAPPKATAKAFPASSCNSCHESNAADDWVFTQYYPVIRAAIAEANGKPLTTNNQWQPLGPHPEKAASMPLERAELHKWLKSGQYKTFPAKHTANVSGTGPHVKPGNPIRVFYNQELATSFEKGSAEHPVGAIAVKEMFSEKDELIGWAVMAKTAADSKGGKGWFWYEALSTTDDGAVAAAGAGVPGCFGCHATNSRDLVLTRWPLK